jgi:hypothetical protein
MKNLINWPLYGYKKSLAVPGKDLLVTAKLFIAAPFSMG